MKASARRFLFDDDFSEGAAIRRVDIEALKADALEAYERGVADGRRLAGDALAGRMTQALEQVADRAATALDMLAQQRERLEGEAARLARSFAGKLAGRLIERLPLAPLDEAAAECFRHLAGQPHVVVRVPEDLVDEAKTVVDKIALERGLQGKLVILGEPGFGAGDFCIEWADGGIQRDGAELERAIDAAIARRFEGG